MLFNFIYTSLKYVRYFCLQILSPLSQNFDIFAAGLLPPGSASSSCYYYNIRLYYCDVRLYYYNITLYYCDVRLYYCDVRLKLL